MSSQLFTGSICLSDLIAAAKAEHSAFSKASNGKIYANISVWVNEKPDDYGNHVSLQINPKKDDQNHSRKYFGNAKKFSIEPETVSKEDVANLPADDDLPF